MMINRRNTKEPADGPQDSTSSSSSCSRNINSNRQTWKARRTMTMPLTMSLLALVAAVSFITTLTPVEARQQAPHQPANTDEDLQVIFTEPVENLVTDASWYQADTPSISLYEQELGRCKLSKSKLLLSFVLQNANWQDVAEKERSRAVHRLSKFFAIPKDFFSLDDISKTDIYEMLRNSVKRGVHHLTPTYTRKLGRLSFVVGCNNEMFPTGKLIASQIGEQMNEGLIDDITDLSFDWWLVWTQRINSRMNRAKRETAPEGSGDGDDYDTEYDYGDGDGEDQDPDGGITEVPVQTTPRAHRHHHGDGGSSSSSTSNKKEERPKEVDLEEEDGDLVDEEDQEENVIKDSVSGAAALDTTITPVVVVTTTPVPQNPTTERAPLTTTESTPIDTTTETVVTTTTRTIILSTTTAIPSGQTPEGTTTAAAASDYDYEYDDKDDEAEEEASEKINEISPSTPRSSVSLNIFTTPSTTTTEKEVEVTTEYVEPEVQNSPPVIKSRLPKQPLTAGKPFGFAIPMETFYDAEDGTDLKLSLLDKSDQPLKSTSWIQFDEQKREVYGLPLEEAVSRWQYKLHATDKAGESVVETLDLTVHQHKSYRSVNHEISLGLKLTSEFKNSVDWQLQLIRGIVEQLGDSDMSNILVREIRSTGSDASPWTFVFTNDTLPKDKCTEEELAELLKRFDTTELNQLLAPEIVVTSISGQQIGNCQKTSVVKTAKPTPSIAKNYPPLTRNQVDRVTAFVGQLLVFQVPLDTFYDPEDKTDLKLSLLTSERQKLDPRHWLQFDSKNREFYGIPLLMDVGQKEYLLVAEDSEGLTATDALVVTVSHSKQRDHNVMIQLNLNATVDSINSPMFQRRFVERLAQVFGDEDTSMIKVRALPQQFNRGQQSTFTYYNTSIYRKPNQQCPDDEIEKLRSVLVDSDGQLKDSAKITFGSEFKVFRAQFVPAGSCQADTSSYEPVKPLRPTGEKQVPTNTKDDYMMTFILPAAIILAMLILGSVIACVLHRKRMTGKMELGDEEERRSFRSKGIPVIFHDELDEKPEIVTKSPIILKDEKPPLLPPSYNSTAIDGDSEDVDEYLPPAHPVMMGSRESRGKSPVTPSYRKPPPYVSP